ncbi:MAG: Outer rane receptor for ferrienterochelin and colicin [Sphingobacteriaceae bacterium]|jgi:TonB-linked SusC/RagA family outer membrane protein|nr:Outer rane receptor for ferrienterochelin and colicin [Sphingobacteriaceae bacterium]
MKRLLSSLFVLLFVAVAAFGQERTVTGTVTASDDGLPLPGVSVKVKGTQAGTQTGVNGQFSLIVPANSSVLVFSYIGYSEQEVAVGSRSTINVTLKVDARQLSEVVVTGALGIQRQKKEIGYATANVSNETLTAARPVNVANGLQGKVSGLNITSINSGVFEDVKINLRGIRSLTGNNNPMLLLDGIQSSLGYLSSINPNDIADVTILKGASAAAIYGPDARNGVIVVTTKKGSANPVITFGHSTQLSQISFYPKLQEEFGSGGYGDYTPYENWSWGPAFDGSTVEIGHTLPDGSVQTIPYSPTNARKEFFNTGTTFQNDLSFSVKDFYISVQDANINGIVPDDKSRRTGIRLNTSREYGIVKVGLNTNFINQDYNIFDDNAMENYNIANNVGLNGGLMNLIFNTPADIPLTSYKDFENDPYAQYNTYFNDYGLNPYFAIDNWRNKGRRSDLITSLDLNLKAADWVNFTFRGGLTSRNIDENYTSKGEVPTAYGIGRGFTLVQGALSERAYNSKRYSSELFANLSKQLTPDFKLSGILGTYLRQTDVRDASVGAANLVVPELFNTANRTGELTGGSAISRSRLFSLYGSASVNYKGWANLEVVGRNDRTSVLALDNNSFFYPGVNAAVVLTDAVEGLKGNALSYLKLRGSWNKTGNADISPYLLEATFGQASGFPYGSLAGFTANNTTYDASLEPEFIESTEFGVESGFFDGRMSLEATYYTSNNNNQIIPISVSSSTGYTNAFVNAASFKNKGVELDLKLKTNTRSNFKPRLNINASYNDSEITSIYEGLDELFIGGYAAAGNYAIKGYPAFVIKATDYNRDPQGRVIVDANTGYPTANPNNQIFGRTLPKWIVGINPSFDYKNFSLSILGEYKGGHYSYANIGGDMAWTGVSAATAANHREKFVIPNSSIADPNNPGQYIANNNVVVTNVNDFYTGVYRSVKTNFLTSAAAWRLREVSLSYGLPTSLLSKQKFVKSATVALTGRNLLLLLPKTNEFQDPDFNFSEGNTAGISNSQINPPIRTFGATLSVNF